MVPRRSKVILLIGYVIAIAGAAILTVGVFAALNQLQVAPAIVTGLFYAILAIVVGSAVIAIGGGGVKPMQQAKNDKREILSERWKGLYA